jgi:hypothetical protein
MRTTIQRIVFQAKDVLGLTDRPYAVEGTITFTMCSTYRECDLEELRRAILEVDKQFPWKDVDEFRNASVPSIKYLGVGNVVIQNWTIPEKSCHFMVVPGIANLKKGQLHAYEQYLSKVAEELAQKKLPNVNKVHYLVRTVTSKEFAVTR